MNLSCGQIDIQQEDKLKEDPIWDLNISAYL